MSQTISKATVIPTIISFENLLRNKEVIANRWNFDAVL